MYPNASTEPLSVIEANECSAQPGSLATTRFQACFNEIERLRLALRDIKNVAILSGDPRLTERRIREICQPFEHLQ